MAAGLFILLVLVALIGAGIAMIVVGARRRGPGYSSCGRCGYDVRGATRIADRCPECGVPFTEAGIIPAGRRPGGKVLVIAGVCVVTLPLTCGTGSVLSLMQARAARTQAVQQMIRAQQQAAAATAAAARTAGAGTDAGTDADTAPD